MLTENDTRNRVKFTVTKLTNRFAAVTYFKQNGSVAELITKNRL
mgnify:CR=1 FL=1